MSVREVYLASMAKRYLLFITFLVGTLLDNFSFNYIRSLLCTNFFLRL